MVTASLPSPSLGPGGYSRNTAAASPPCKSQQTKTTTTSKHGRTQQICLLPHDFPQTQHPAPPTLGPGQPRPFPVCQCRARHRLVLVPSVLTTWPRACLVLLSSALPKSLEALGSPSKPSKPPKPPGCAQSPPGHRCPRPEIDLADLTSALPASSPSSPCRGPPFSSRQLALATRCLPRACCGCCCAGCRNPRVICVLLVRVAGRNCALLFPGVLPLGPPSPADGVP